MSRRHDFPIFTTHPKLCYLDSASTTQKPRAVIDAEKLFYEQQYANVHRGIYFLSEDATFQYENVRKKVQSFIQADSAHEIIFTSGTTESINLVAHSFGLANIQTGDEIILSMMEHHSNIVPWQQLCERVGASLKIITLHENGELNLDHYHSLINDRTKLIALTHASNVLGVINPIKKIIATAHEKNIPVLIDGAQAVAHIPVDVRDLDCDFYVFSAHKLYGPTGVGILYAKTVFLEKMIPYQTGGNMIRTVSFEKTTFNELPNRFEAGTPNIAGVIALGAAIDYVEEIGFDSICVHEQQLSSYAETVLSGISGLHIYGSSAHRTGVISFAYDHAHAHDIATILDEQNVCVRAGHHCAMPLMSYLKVNALTRISFGIYNELRDIDALVLGLENVRTIFA